MAAISSKTHASSLVHFDDLYAHSRLAYLKWRSKGYSFLGINLPALITENKPLAETIEEVHETAGTVGYYLIRIHALAGLFHHYVQRDNTLRRMLPK
jgi:cytochrome b561